MRLSWSMHQRELAQLQAERDAALRALSGRRNKP
jgi:hypothetical protein